MNDSEEHIDLWVACSGGMDSVFLARILHQSGKKIGLIHCNFQLREKASDHDEAFVAQLARELNTPLRIQRFNAFEYAKNSNLNTQEIARKLRYDWFYKIYCEKDKPIAVAHHFDDQVETFFIQLLRGGSVRGLAGMPKSRNGILRPMLHISKKEILHLCETFKWEWREDASNQSNKYQRNQLRNELLPSLIKKGLHEKTIHALCHDYSQLVKILNQWNPQIYREEDMYIRRDYWEALPLLLRKEVIRKSGLSSTLYTALDEFIHSKKGSQLIHSSKTFLHEGDGISIIEHSVCPPHFTFDTIELETHELENWKEAPYLLFDRTKIKGKITVRIWQQGDRFYPLGMSGTKLVSKYLRDKKVKHFQRIDQPVICDETGVIGLPGHCPDDRKKITSKTKLILAIRVTSIDKGK